MVFTKVRSTNFTSQHRSLFAFQSSPQKQKILHPYNDYNGTYVNAWTHFLALFNRNRNEKIPRAKVCQNHPLALAGSTLFAKNQANTASPICAAMARMNTVLTICIDRRKKRLIALKHGTGPMSGKKAAQNSIDIPITQNNHAYIVGPCKLFFFLSCQYEMVAAMPSLGLTIGT